MAYRELRATTERTHAPHLPVPALHQSLDRYLGALAPLLSQQQHRLVTEAAAEFEVHEGATCQAALRSLADQENADGRSWLSEAWLSEYLVNRAPLTLSSNVGFRIRPSGHARGITRAADAIHRFACVHLGHLRGEIPDEISPRGNPLDMRQWSVLAGGLRHPRPVQDVFRDGSPTAADREIGILWRGRMLMMPISDENGLPCSTSALTATLQQLTALPPVGDDTFTHLSYLGSDKAADHLQILLGHPGNATTYQRLTDAMFVVNLLEEPADAECQQERQTFEPGQAWAYKPFTYQVSLVEDFLGVHTEHSVVDGVTLRSMIASMQEVEPEPTRNDGTPLLLDPLTWVMSDDRRDTIANDIAGYRRRADDHRVQLLTCAVAVPIDSRFTVSHDAIQQFSLLYAQLHAYGRVRSTYEAVDMREFQAGRTECLRPITTGALALVRALLDGVATAEHLHEALAAHKSNVIACKTGQGFSRHLFGLQLMADRLGLDPPLFRDESYRALTTDFLSTTSVGDDRQIMRFTFAPTSVGGIGVNYTVVGDTYEFCLTHDVSRTGGIDDFIDGIRTGVAALAGLLAEAHRH